MLNNYLIGYMLRELKIDNITNIKKEVIDKLKED